MTSSAQSRSKKAYEGLIKDVTFPKGDHLMMYMDKWGVLPTSCPDAHVGHIRATPIVYIQREFDTLYKDTVNIHEYFTALHIGLYDIYCGFNLSTEGPMADDISGAWVLADRMAHHGWGGPSHYRLYVSTAVHHSLFGGAPNKTLVAGDVDGAVPTDAKLDMGTMVDVTIVRATKKGSCLGMCAMTLSALSRFPADLVTCAPIPPSKGPSAENSSATGKSYRRQRRRGKGGAKQQSTLQNEPTIPQTPHCHSATAVQWMDIMVPSILEHARLPITAESGRFRADPDGTLVYALGDDKEHYRLFDAFCVERARDKRGMIEHFEAALVRRMFHNDIVLGESGAQMGIYSAQGLTLPNRAVAQIVDPAVYRAMAPLVTDAIKSSDWVGRVPSRTLIAWYMSPCCATLRQRMLDVWVDAKALALEESIESDMAVCMGERHMKRAVDKYMRASVARNMWAHVSPSFV